MLLNWIGCLPATVLKRTCVCALNTHSFTAPLLTSAPACVPWLPLFSASPSPGIVEGEPLHSTSSDSSSSTTTRACALSWTLTSSSLRTTCSNGSVSRYRVHTYTLESTIPSVHVCLCNAYIYVHMYYTLRFPCSCLSVAQTCMYMYV